MNTIEFPLCKMRRGYPFYWVVGWRDKSWQTIENMFKHFLSELRHRKVLRTAAGYALLAAAAVEFTDIITPAFGLPALIVVTIRAMESPVVLLAPENCGKQTALGRNHRSLLRSQPTFSSA